MQFDLQLLIETIRNRRLALQYKQEYVAACLGVSQNAYSKLELGRCHLTVQRLIDVCRILEIDVYEMLKPAMQVA
ncbi:helix-turn-helix domain-containing protein [Mucilaginibacter glaciei]|uniref:Helix-turn-helix transcriptional regulator n=1 Tax=Mucilaginibacter glaciei TaxID=2772109 RepID=A0A926S0V2_9SPHI|nr:helix-turn-helix transcriptional regulator [Mucilaginibacter glaciei]MBD1393355.1 helix-turn-helix transcriptional regulator [Mucilaginibacter glaciei]